MVLTGAGMSAESGISTFRDSNGLWENHDVMEVASIEGWHRNPELVLQFYNQRRAQLKEVSPNEAHYFLADLENHYELQIITQNVDDLHERAGSQNIIHLHGELRKVRSDKSPLLIKEWEEDVLLGDLSEDGTQLRPHIVWFGEEVPELQNAVVEMKNADIVIIIGTSMQVYPAASLYTYTPHDSPIITVNPQYTPIPDSNYQFDYINETAVNAIPKLKEILL